MPTTEFEKQKEVLINNIRDAITEEKELDTLINQFNKIMMRKAAKEKKAQKVKVSNIHAFYSRNRVSSIASLESMNNITHEEALQELHKLLGTWK